MKLIAQATAIVVLGAALIAGALVFGVWSWNECRKTQTFWQCLATAAI